MRQREPLARQEARVGGCVVGLWHVDVSAHRGGGAAQTLRMCMCDC